MRVAIIDYLSLCREEMRKCLYRYLEENYAGEEPVIKEFAGGEEFLSCFVPEVWDIIFIDQYMTGISGIDTARKIRETDRLVALVFVTTSESHAIESYGVRACGYLLKPYLYEDFARTMDLAGLDKVRSARFIRMEEEKILLHEILWCDRDEHYIQVHTDKRGILRFRNSFKEFADMFDTYPQFLNCYKGCIVNAERVERIDGLDFLMDNGVRIPFARREKKKLETLFNSYLFRKEREDALL